MVLRDPNKKQIAVIAEKNGLIYLKKRGIGHSEFFRQAVIAYKEGQFKFKYINED